MAILVLQKSLGILKKGTYIWSHSHWIEWNICRWIIRDINMYTTISLAAYKQAATTVAKNENTQ